MNSLGDLIALAVACGATRVGGPLSADEQALTAKTGPISPALRRRTLDAIRSGDDPLGDLFCTLRSAVDRRALGAFYTRPSIVEPMVEWVASNAPTRVVDAGCGSGRFAIALARRIPDAELIAIDLDPVATLMTRAALFALKVRNVRVLNADYLSVALPAHAGRTAFIGNPPYVRHHDLPPSTKVRAKALAAAAGYHVSGIAGLHALFYLATLAHHGKSGDVGTFVTSSEWLDVGYGSLIRKMFTNGLGGGALLVFDPASIPFDDAMTTAAITAFEVGATVEQPRIGRIAGVDAVLDLRDGGAHVSRAILESASRWSPLLALSEQSVAGASIGDLFRVSRGQVTGANHFFVMTKAQARSRGIARFCVPLISRAEELFAGRGVVHDNAQRMVGLEIPRDLDIAKHPKLAEYVREGERLGVHRGYVASHREPWYAVSFPRPPIIATYMARQAPLFSSNPDGLAILNVAHGLYPRQPMSARALARVVRALNANRSTFVGRGRTYHGGLEKFEPGEMERLPLEAAV